MNRLLKWAIEDATASAGPKTLRRKCGGWFWSGFLIGGACVALLSTCAPT